MNECFGIKDNKCKVLKVKKCVGYDTCTFFKTKERLKEEEGNTNKRIARLSYSSQEDISNNYYDDEFPWEDEVI